MAVTGITAATVANGRVIALVRMCPGVGADKLFSGSWGPVDYQTEWTPGPGGISDVDLGEIDNFIHGREDDRFWIQTWASSGDGGFVAFSPEDIRGLSDGDVLINGTKQFGPRVMTMAEFDATVEEQCRRFK